MDRDDKHSRARDPSSQENLFLTTPSLHFPEVSHGNGGGRAHSSIFWGRKRIVHRKCVKPKVRLGTVFKWGQLEMLEPQENIQAWLYLRLRVAKTNQSSSRSWGEFPPKQGLLGQRLLQQGGAGMMGWSGPGPALLL